MGERKRRGEQRAGALDREIAQLRHAAFVGRRALIDSALALTRDDRGAAVLWVWGPGGAGKSALLYELAWQAEAAGLEVAGAGAGEGGERWGAPPDREAALQALEATEFEGRGLLLVDDLGVNDPRSPWLQRVLPDRLPPGWGVVITSSAPPSAPWRGPGGWGPGLQVEALPALEASEVSAALRAGGAEADGIEALVELVGGHPSLLAWALAGPQVEGELAPGALWEWLPLSEPPGPPAEATAALIYLEVGQPLSEDLFSALAADLSDPRAWFSWLLGLALTELAPGGLRPRPGIAALLRRELEWRHPWALARGRRRCAELLAGGMERLPLRARPEAGRRLVDALLAVVVGDHGRAPASGLRCLEAGEAAELWRERASGASGVTGRLYLPHSPAEGGGYDGVGALGDWFARELSQAAPGLSGLLAPGGLIPPPLAEAFALGRALVGEGEELWTLDLRVETPGAWARRVLEPPGGRTRAPPPLDRAGFEREVRAALRGFHRPAALEQSPLLMSPLGRPAADGGSGPLARVRALREALVVAGRGLAMTPKGKRRWEVLSRTYLEGGGAPDEIAAELGMAPSTYRRWLKGAVQDLSAALWTRMEEGSRARHA